MGTIGPLTHMQAERRAFWILRTVPVPLGRLLAAKARTWALIIGGLAALVFAVMSLSRAARVGRRAAGGGGCWSRPARPASASSRWRWPSAGADLSDDTNTAVGPTTIYGYLLVGGLFNLVLVEDAVTCFAGLALYAFAGWAYWQAGVEQAAFCLDAEVVRARRVRAADGATMLIVFAVGGRAVLGIGRMIAQGGVPAGDLRRIMVGLQAGLLALIGVAAVLYLRRRPKASARRAAGVVAAAGRGRGRRRGGVAAGGGGTERGFAAGGDRGRRAAGGRPGARASRRRATGGAGALRRARGRRACRERDSRERDRRERELARAVRGRGGQLRGGRHRDGVVAHLDGPRRCRVGPAAFAALAALALVQAVAAAVYAATGRVAIVDDSRTPSSSVLLLSPSESSRYR